MFTPLRCAVPEDSVRPAPAGANSCITQSDLAPFVPISNTGPLPPGTVLFFGQPDYRNPQSQQASLGFEREIGNGLSVAASYIYVHTTHLPWAIDKNLLPGAPIVSGAPGANGLPTNGLPFQDWKSLQCVTNATLCFADPTRTILQNNEYASLANAVYHGGILEVKKRFTDRFTLLANYTYSKAIDDSTGFNSDYAAFNEVNLGAERSLSDFDHRHKVVVAALVESPWQNSRVLSGFELSPVVTYNSGHRLHNPDITLMDLQMPDMNGTDAMIAVRSEFPDARVIILTTYSGDVQVSRALKAGARAYLLKSLLRKELLHTIRAVHTGQKRIPPELATQLADHLADDSLTTREIRFCD